MQIEFIMIAPLTLGLLEVLKRSKKVNTLLEGYWEIVAIALSVVLALAGGLDVLSGVVAGLTSMGLYDATARGVEMMRESQK